MSEHDNNELRWYVIHTYSGYENKVRANIEKLVENRNMENDIVELSIPMEEVVEIKNGQKKVVERMKFPGYVLVKMKMNDDTWYVVRNTRGVTSFVGPGSKPVPLTDAEVIAMGLESVNMADIDIKQGDSVLITTGPFADSVGTVKEVNFNKKTVTVSVSMFGRETPTELNFTHVQLID